MGNGRPACICWKEDDLRITCRHCQQEKQECCGHMCVCAMCNILCADKQRSIAQTTFWIVAAFVTSDNRKEAHHVTLPPDPGTMPVTINYAFAGWGNVYQSFRRYESACKPSPTPQGPCAECRRQVSCWSLGVAAKRHQPSDHSQNPHRLVP